MLVLTFWLAASHAIAAGDYLSYLSNNPPWNNYLPANYDIVKKKGDAAFYWSNEADPEKIDDHRLVMRDPYIIIKPSSVVEVERKTNSGVVIYKRKYTVDEMSRRLTPVKKDEIDTRRNLIFIGGSFTFGTGLADDETFPYYFSQYRPNFNVYNLGIYSAGANDMLDDMRSFARFTDIPKTGGIVFYTAIFDQIEKSVCQLGCYTSPGRKSVLKKSNYQYDSVSQGLVNRGSFESSQPITTIIFDLLGKIGLIDTISIPFKLTDDRIELYVMMIAEMKKISRDRLKADFYFTMYPGYYENWDRIKPFLKKYGIKYLDLSKMDFKTATNQRHSIVYDGDPTPLSNYLFASLIHHQLPK